MSKTNINAHEVYDIVTGIITEEESRKYPKIKSEFCEGSECDKLYGEVYDAKMRLNKRLNEDEDDDVETIINSMLDICRIIGCKMYHYGAEI